MTAEQMIKREFEKAAAEQVMSVTFTEDERILVATERDTYTMEIGSDDDEFVFISECGSEEVRFAFPEDNWQEVRDGDRT